MTVIMAGIVAATLLALTLGVVPSLAGERTLSDKERVEQRSVASASMGGEIQSLAQQNQPLRRMSGRGSGGLVCGGSQVAQRRGKYFFKFG